MNTRQAITADYKRLSDEELVYRFVQKHEQEAMDVIFDKYGHIVYGICLKHLGNTDTARTEMQQIFIRLLDDVVKYKIDNFKPWFFDIVRNHCQLKAGKALPVSKNSFETYSQNDTKEDWQNMLMQESKLQQLEKEIAGLSSENRSILEQFYVQQSTYKEISTRQNIAVTKVMQILQTTRRRLMSVITGEKQQYE